METNLESLEERITEKSDWLTDTEFLAADIRRERDAAIREARAAGLTYRRIAALAYVSPQTIVNICREEEQ
jgi:hypothetical protein